MKKLLKNPLLLLVIGFILGYITSVIADTINSNEVLYDNSNVNSNVDNVQDALDEVYNIIDHNSVGFSLLTHNPDGLSAELVAGLYRYQGVQDANNSVNNYICFGTTNKNDCTSDTDKYMYRIIGINESGQMKLIKKEALNTGYPWHSSKVNWPSSSLFAGLNGSYFLTNSTYVPTGWENRIATTNWHYGYTEKNNSAAVVAATELGFNDSVSAKIGLIYLHDYYYGLPGGNNCKNSASICKTSWIFILNNDSSAPGIVEFDLSTASNGLVNGIRFVSPYEGVVDGRNVSESAAIRPVFFLKSSETIVSGSGSLVDPFILS